MKTKISKNGFTLAELLTAIVIITILIGILLPALNMARNFAINTKQSALINSLDVGINMYKNDFGEYPQSHGYNDSSPAAYYGAETLAEAMFGCDLIGFHPKSVFDKSKNYPTTSSSSVYYDASGVGTNFKERKDLYVDRTNIGVFQVRDVYQKILSPPTTDDAYVICDTFDVINETITLPSGLSTKKFKIGTPILYFRANTEGIDIKSTTPTADRIYDYEDNENLIALGTVKDGKSQDYFTENTVTATIKTNFLTYIEDPVSSTTARPRPIRPDSYLLISAGKDGLYGTTDDICNFEPNIE